jgi:hypothetical protein
MEQAYGRAKPQVWVTCIISLNETNYHGEYRQTERVARVVVKFSLPENNKTPCSNKKIHKKH